METDREKCSYCGGWYPKPISLHHDVNDCTGGENRQEMYAADQQTTFKAADGSMMCEKHPGYEWGLCPGGSDCAGPGMPWTISGRTLIEETLSEAMAVARRAGQ